MTKVETRKPKVKPREESPHAAGPAAETEVRRLYESELVVEREQSRMGRDGLGWDVRKSKDLSGLALRGSG